MSTKLILPRRTEPIIDDDKSPTKRFFQFLDSIPEIADSQTNLTITWTSNEPTAGTTQTIANGSSPTVAETGQAIKNINEQLNNLITELKAAGIIAS